MIDYNIIKDYKLIGTLKFCLINRPEDFKDKKNYYIAVLMAEEFNDKDIKEILKTFKHMTEANTMRGFLQDTYINPRSGLNHWNFNRPFPEITAHDIVGVQPISDSTMNVQGVLTWDNIQWDTTQGELECIRPEVLQWDTTQGELECISQPTPIPFQRWGLELDPPLA